MVHDISVTQCGGVGGFWALDHDERTDAMAYWQIRHAHKIDAAQRARASAGASPDLDPSDLRNILTAGFSLGDANVMFGRWVDATMAMHGKKPKRTTFAHSGPGQMLAAGKKRGASKASLDFWRKAAKG